MRNFFDHDIAKDVYYIHLYKNITKLGLTQSGIFKHIQIVG